MAFSHQLLRVCLFCVGVGSGVSILGLRGTERAGHELSSSALGGEAMEDHYEFAMASSVPWTPLTEEQKNASLKVWMEDLESSKSRVGQFKVRPAKDTNRVALTILQPATPEKIRLMAHVIRLNMHRLGPEWALQVYYCLEEEKDALYHLLGEPENVIWSPIMLRGARVPALGRTQFSWYLLSMDFWRMIPEKLEHVLIFGDDSIVLKGRGCVDDFLYYDYVGSPWNDALKNMPRYGGNGGFRLVRRSSSIASLDSPLIERMRQVSPGKQRVHEDEAFVRLIRSINGTFPSREASAAFAVETVMHPSPCAVHKPWLYQTRENMAALLNSADPL